MRNSADTDASNLEAEYIRMKVTLYKNLFKYCTVVVLILFTKEAVRAVWYGKIASLIMILVTFTFGSLFAYFIRKHKNLELFITISLALFYLSSLVTQYYSNSGYFEQPLQAWNLAYAYAAFERIVLARIAKLSHRICFLVVNTTVRALTLRAPETGLIVMQFVYMSFTIYLDIDKERYDKRFFETYFRNKEQLLKFKNLVVQDIPESIMIISQDLTRPLFVNNSFEQLIEDNTNLPIHTRLKEFFIQDSLDVSQESSSQSSSSASLPARRHTLLRFLESTVLQINRSTENQKFSCNLTYKKSTQNNQIEGEYNQNYMFEAKIVHLLWDEEPAIAVILHDITQQHTILSLKIADAHKDTILATVSHELRTPLNGIMGMIQIVQKRVKDAEIMNYLNICKNSGDLLLSLVNSILDLNQIRAKKLKLTIERVKLSELLENIVRLFQFQCEHKGLELKLRIASNCSQFITTDKNRLSQIFINLVGNALKFTQKGSITISAFETYNPEEVAFSVEDTGSGIKDEDQRKLFKMFGKLEQSDNTVNPHGVGLGLTISDTLARLLGNSGIELESEFGRGSKFTFAVKKHLKNTAESLELDTDLHRMVMDEKVDVQNKMLNYSREYIKTSQHHTMTDRQFTRTITSIDLSHSSMPNFLRKDSLSFSVGAPYSLQHLSSHNHKNDKSNITPYVLIVDDNPLNVIIAESLVNSHGCKAKTALYGQVAIDIILNTNYAVEPIKLIFMDCQMPVMDGFMATKILKKMMAEKKIPEIPIVALTANDSDADREASKKVGMCEHMTKPLNEGELTRILNKYMPRGR